MIFFLFHVLQTIVHLVYTYHMVIRSTLTYGIHRKPNSLRLMHQGSHPHHGFLKHGVLSQELVQINNLVNNMVEERFKDHWFHVVENCTRHKNTIMRYLVMYARPTADTWAHL